MNCKGTLLLGLLSLLAPSVSAQSGPYPAASAENVPGLRFETPKFLYGRIDGVGSEFGSPLNTLQRMSDSPRASLTILAPLLAKSASQHILAGSALRSSVLLGDPMPFTAGIELKSGNAHSPKPLFLNAHLTKNQIVASRLNPLTELVASKFDFAADRLQAPKTKDVMLRQSIQSQARTNLVPMVSQKSNWDEHPLDAKEIGPTRDFELTADLKNPKEIYATLRDPELNPTKNLEALTPVRELVPSEGMKERPRSPERIPFKSSKARHSDPELIPSENLKARQSVPELIPFENVKVRQSVPELIPFENVKARHSVPELIPFENVKVRPLFPELVPAENLKAQPLTAELVPSKLSPVQNLGVELIPSKNAQAQLRDVPKRNAEEPLRQLVRTNKLADDCLDSNHTHPAELIASASRMPREDLHGELMRAKRSSLEQEKIANWSNEKTVKHKKPQELQAKALANTGEDSVSWDEWFANFGKLGDEQLVSKLEKYGNPAGANSVTVTVTRNNEVKIKISSQDESLFDKATIEAYTALNGCEGLAFPKGTQRKSISFIIDNSRETAGAVTGVNGRRYTGLKESR